MTDKPKLDVGRWTQLLTDIYDMIINEYHEGDADSLKSFEQDDLRDLILNVMNDNLAKDFPIGLTKNTKVTIHE
jgi:hypothetical protein